MHPCATEDVMNPETNGITQATMRGTAVGAMLLTLFGALWAFAALSNWPHAPSWAFSIVILVLIALTTFSAMRLAAAKLEPVYETIQTPHSERNAKTRFAALFAGEMIGIAVVVILLGHAGYPLLIPIVITVIVGLHFFPLARIFHIPIYWGTGTALIVCAVASLLIVNEHVRLLVLGIAVALVLWTTAAIILSVAHGYRKSINL